MRVVYIAGAVALILLVGCTGSGHGSPVSSAPTTSKAMEAKCRHLVSTWRPSRNGIVARPADGSHLRMRVGDTRRFHIVTKPDPYTGWTPPGVSNPHILRLTDVRDPLRKGTSYNCIVSGTIVARASGTASVGASTDNPCFHMKHYSCGLPSTGWSAKVTVVSG